MTNMIPVTVIEHAGPFPPSMEAEFVIRTKTYPGIIFVDTERKTVWIPFDGWSKKETK